MNALSIICKREPLLPLLRSATRRTVLLIESRPGRAQTKSAQDAARKAGKERRTRISLTRPAHLAQERSMSSEMKCFVLGIAITLVVLAGSAYLSAGWRSSAVRRQG